MLWLLVSWQKCLPSLKVTHNVKSWTLLFFAAFFFKECPVHFFNIYAQSYLTEKKDQRISFLCTGNGYNKVMFSVAWSSNNKARRWGTLIYWCTHVWTRKHRKLVTKKSPIFKKRVALWFFGICTTTVRGGHFFSPWVSSYNDTLEQEILI